MIKWFGYAYCLSYQPSLQDFGLHYHRLSDKATDYIITTTTTTMSLSKHCVLRRAVNLLAASKVKFAHVCQQGKFQAIVHQENKTRYSAFFFFSNNVLHHTIMGRCIDAVSIWNTVPVRYRKTFFFFLKRLKTDVQFSNIQFAAVTCKYLWREWTHLFFLVVIFA